MWSLDLHTRLPSCSVTQGHTTSRILQSTRCSKKPHQSRAGGAGSSCTTCQSPKLSARKLLAFSYCAQLDESDSTMIGVLQQTHDGGCHPVHWFDARNAEGPPDTVELC